MKNFKRFAVLLAVPAMGITMAACGGGNAEETTGVTEVVTDSTEATSETTTQTTTATTKATTTAAPTTAAPTTTAAPKQTTAAPKQTTAAATKAAKSVVSKTPFYDCDGSGHGYYEIVYSDGSKGYEEF